MYCPVSVDTLGMVEAEAINTSGRQLARGQRVGAIAVSTCASIHRVSR